MRRLGERIAKLEAAAGKVCGKIHSLFVWSSWDRERVLDHYGRDRIEPGDQVQFLVWKDDHLPEPMPFPPAGEKLS